MKGLEMNLGTLLVLSPAFSALRLSFLSLTCPDPSASLHHAQRVGIFFSPALNFPPVPLRPSARSSCQEV